LNKYRTVSIPKPLYDDIAWLIDEVGYWPSVASFVREACIQKLQEERDRLRAANEEAEG